MASGQEGGRRPPQVGVTPNLIRRRGDGRVEPTGGTSRAPDPDQGCPEHVRWSFLLFYWSRFGRLESFHRHFLTQEVGKASSRDDGGESREPAGQRGRRHAPLRCRPFTNSVFQERRR